MADGLGVAASVAGIVTAAVQSIQFLSTTIDNIKDAPGTIRNINLDLRVVEPVLRKLDTASQSDGSQIVLSAEVKSAVENCNRACTDFQMLLSGWMKHSTEEKIFWADRWRVGLFGQERIKTFKAQLSDCKSTLNVALQTAHILTSIQQGYLMKEMKDMMLQQNEVVIHRDIHRAESERSAIENSLQQLPVSSAQLSEEAEVSRQELLQEIQKQKASNDNFRRMCEEMLSRTVYERTGQKIKGVRATDDSAALAGFVNITGEGLKIDQDISDVTADKRSFAAAGVIMNMDFRDLLGRSR
jgi:hypothetical protein